MANAVQITITVDSSQAIPSIDQIGAALNAVGVQGEVSIGKANNALRATGGHAATSLDAVRLLSQEFGLRLPRAIEAMLSRMPAVTSAIGGMLSGMVAVAAVEVFVHLAEEAVAFYNKMCDVNAAMREFLATSGKAASQRLFDEASLESSIGLLKNANQEIDFLNQKRIAAGANKPGGGFLQYFTTAEPGTDAELNKAYGVMGTFSKADGERLAKLNEQATIASARQQQMQRDQDTQQLKDRLNARAQAATAGNRAAIELDNERQISAQEQRDQFAKEQALQNIEKSTRARQLAEGMKENDPKLTDVHSVDANAGKEEQRIKDLKAQEDYAAKTTALGRETAMTLMKLDHERVESALGGEELFHQKLMDDLAEMRLRLNNAGQTRLIGANTATITEKYSGDESERW